MNGFLGVAVDLLVAVLLVATIISALGLSRRMSRMKADESTMRATIGDLMVATDTAERAIAALKAMLGESDRTLGERLRTAERYSVDLAHRVQAGETVMSRIAQIVDTSRRGTELDGAPRPPKPSNDVTGNLKGGVKPEAKAGNEGILTAAAATAQAVADRAARRLGARAA
jgi:hypothetical protein